VYNETVHQLFLDFNEAYDLHRMDKGRGARASLWPTLVHTYIHTYIYTYLGWINCAIFSMGFGYPWKWLA
jgi:hypothetical protein